MLCLLFFVFIIVHSCFCNNCIQPNGPYERLHPDECLFSAKKRFKFCYGTSACIIEVATGITTWCAFSNVPNPFGIFAKIDGSVVAVSTTGDIYWKIDPGALGYFILQDDGNLVYYKSLGGKRWSCYGLNKNWCPVSGPTGVTTCQNTLYPTLLPTRSPTRIPTIRPTINPTNAPYSSPPTFHPTSLPTALPSVFPTVPPTLLPSHLPTSTSSPTISLSPTFSPTSLPTWFPTITTLHPTFPKLRSSLESFEIQAKQTISGVNYNSLKEEIRNEIIKFAIVSCLPETPGNIPPAFISYQASFTERPPAKCGSDTKQAILISYSLSIISSLKPSTTVLALKDAVERGNFTRTLYEQGISYNSSAFQAAKSCDFQVSTESASTKTFPPETDNRGIIILLFIPISFCVIGSLVMAFFTIFPKMLVNKMS